MSRHWPIMPKIESRPSNARYSRCAVVNRFLALLLTRQPRLWTIGHHRPELHQNQSYNAQRILYRLRPPSLIILPLHRHLPRPRHLSQRFLLRHQLRHHPFTPTQQQRKIHIFHHTNVTSQDHRKAKNAKIIYITRRHPYRTIKSLPKSFRGP
jgi:hypothetical protein